MRINRRFLSWGVFLVAVGGVLVAADLQAVDSTTIVDALRLWPLAVIAVGLGLVLRRTRFSLPAGLLAAAVPGLVLGGAFAVAPRIAADCGIGLSSPTVETQQGTFDGPARIDIQTGCGSLIVGTTPGNGWRLDAGSSGGRTPLVEASSRALSIDAGGRHGWHVFDPGRDAWRLTLPAGSIDGLSLAVNAGKADVGLAGAQIGRLSVTANASQATLDISAASVTTLTGTVNAGQLKLLLPANANLAGSLKVNAGELQVCTPAGLGLHIHRSGSLSGISVNGLQQSGSDWQSVGYVTASYHADLNLSVNLGNVEIDPIGGCK
jgi:hypothetical protein